MGIRSFFSRKKKPKLNSSFLSESRPVSPNSRTPIEELEQVFKKFDVNGDGKISWSELGSIMGSLGHSATEDEWRRMVKEADSDGDGFIDLSEFIDLNTKGVDSTKVLQDVKDAFLVFDIDQNGSISPLELQKVLRSLGDEATISECKKMIAGVDCDGDGMISFEEFKTMMMGSGSSDSSNLESEEQPPPNGFSIFSDRRDEKNATDCDAFLEESLTVSPDPFSIASNKIARFRSCHLISESVDLGMPKHKMEDRMVNVERELGDIKTSIWALTESVKALVLQTELSRSHTRHGNHNHEGSEITNCNNFGGGRSIQEVKLRRSQIGRGLLVGYLKEYSSKVILKHDMSTV
ncbi:hypothetical protein HHK36_024475 [Tetracentron sinense]|uniref:EF-hand domain-containing protein n=1 Tax=Tetracentron sinense TaxID=13715 RepID=A0A834YN64_TETSI|nr:hypothetical protein HHK36_024475 [Tetracentron sinense]